MQVNSINNYQQNTNPNFTAYYFNPSNSQKVRTNFQRALTEYKSSQLLEILQTVRGQQRNSTHITLDTIDTYGGLPCWGYFEGKVNGKILEDGNIFNTSSWRLNKFMKKLAKIADKNDPNPLSKQEQKAIKKEDKLEMKKQKEALSKGKITEFDLKNKLILSIMQYFPI